MEQKRVTEIHSWESHPAFGELPAVSQRTVAVTWLHFAKSLCGGASYEIGRRCALLKCWIKRVLSCQTKRQIRMPPCQLRRRAVEMPPDRQLYLLITYWAAALAEHLLELESTFNVDGNLKNQDSSPMVCLHCQFSVKRTALRASQWRTVSAVPKFRRCDRDASCSNSSSNCFNPEVNRRREETSSPNSGNSNEPSFLVQLTVWNPILDSPNSLTLYTPPKQPNPTIMHSCA
jgi:hypothetical protein